MADERLRALEREAADGDAQAHTRLIVERLRQGDVDPAHVELLAYLGHGPAVSALEGKGPHVPEDADSWVRRLQPWGQRRWVQAAVAAARLVLPLHEAFSPSELAQLQPQEGVEIAEAWLADPSDENAKQAAACGAAIVASFLVNNVEAEDAAHLSPARVVRMAESFRLCRAAAYACSSAGPLVADDPNESQGPSPLTRAVMASVAARERLALGETPTSPDTLSGLHMRAVHADRLGHLPELNTPTANATVREAMRVAVLKSALEEL